MSRGGDFEDLGRRLTTALRRDGPASGRALQAALDVSQPTFSRLVSRLRNDVLVAGRGPATRYALRREVPSAGRTVPIREIDESGRARLLATLHAVEPTGFWIEGAAGEVETGFVPDLPWFLEDLRPSGFLGRLAPRRHPDLGLPEDVRTWSPDHVLRYLVRHGWDLVGNLVVGEEAFASWIAYARGRPVTVDAADRGRVYPLLAADVLSAGTPGSSAAGEQPKFLVVRGPEPTPVLVKFSPPLEDRVARRVADLLVAEHLASRTLARAQVPAATTAVLEGGGRVFLEVERFDRIGYRGRKGIQSLAALDAGFAGTLGTWSRIAEGLRSAGRIDATLERRIRWLDVFGRLIGNADRHAGNLSFLVRGTSPIDLAPVYDMAPAIHAPSHGEIIDREPDLGLPRAGEFDVWSEARRAALAFWEAVAGEPLVSPDFREVARRHAARLAELGDVDDLVPA